MSKLRSQRDHTVARIRELRAMTDPAQIEALESAILADNEPFVHFVARQYQRGIALDDLLAVARAAMLTAIRRFDPDKSSEFPMYASRCMRRDLLNEVRRFSGPVAKPRHEEQWPEGLSMEQQTADGAAFHDTLADETDEEANILRGLDATYVNKLIDGLSDREATVLRLRYGLAGCLPHQLAEIAAVLGVSKQRAQAIEKRAIERLRERLGVLPAIPAAKADMQKASVLAPQEAA